MSFKFGRLKGTDTVEYRYGNIYRREVYPQWSRVTIAPNRLQIPIMLEIAKQWDGPYGILYVLKISRLGRSGARYQNPAPCSFDELELFAYTFQDYFEGDGRHHIWFSDIPSGSQLVYDNHNLIYSYGNDEQVVSLLKAKGFSERDPKIPVPHAHLYNQEFDASEDEVMAYFDWLAFPLQEEHDDP